jgi:hypothetical protein
MLVVVLKEGFLFMKSSRKIWPVVPSDPTTCH